MARIRQPKIIFFILSIVYVQLRCKSKTNSINPANLLRNWLIFVVETLRTNMILNIETSGEYCSVALASNGTLISHLTDIAPLTHAEKITVFIHEILTKNQLLPSQLHAVAVSIGPGSYTGLRIGLAAAKGLCYAQNLPLISLITLETMADAYLQTQETAHLPPHTQLIPMIDARRMEVYTATYDLYINNIIDCKSVILDENYLNNKNVDELCVFIGNGAEKLKAFNKSARFLVNPSSFTNAMYMCRLSYKKYVKKSFENLAYIEPFYLKEAHITQPNQSLKKTKPVKEDVGFKIRPQRP